MFSHLFRIIARKPKSSMTIKSSSPEPVPKDWNEVWEDIEEFEKWVLTQPETVCVDLICRLALRLLPTLFVDDGREFDRADFAITLDAGAEILAYQVDLSSSHPKRLTPMNGHGFFEICSGGSGVYTGSIWHAIESCADSFGSGFLKTYLGEVVANVRRATPKDSIDFDLIFRAVLADKVAWEAWASSGSVSRTRAALIALPLWHGSEPIEMYIEGLPRLRHYLASKGSYAHMQIFSFFTSD